MSSLGALTIRDADFFDPGTFSNESPALKLLPPPKEVPGKQTAKAIKQKKFYVKFQQKKSKQKMEKNYL